MKSPIKKRADVPVNHPVSHRWLVENWRQLVSVDVDAFI